MRKTKLQLTATTIKALTKTDAEPAMATTGYPTYTCRTSDEQLKRDIRKL